MPTRLSTLFKGPKVSTDSSQEPVVFVEDSSLFGDNSTSIEVLSFAFEVGDPLASPFAVVEFLLMSFENMLGSIGSLGIFNFGDVGEMLGTIETVGNIFAINNL